MTGIELDEQGMLFLKAVAARAIEDDECRSAVERGDVDALRDAMPRIMQETISRQADLLMMFRGEKWAHEDPETFRAMALLGDIYQEIRGSEATRA